uniref:Uncharacterized protein n=1 Tax=Arundo donax TaxID=35708 RepID=A0A0A9D930_ARUDO
MLSMHCPFSSSPLYVWLLWTIASSKPDEYATFVSSAPLILFISCRFWALATV